MVNCYLSSRYRMGISLIFLLSLFVHRKESVQLSILHPNHISLRLSSQCLTCPKPPPPPSLSPSPSLSTKHPLNAPPPAPSLPSPVPATVPTLKPTSSMDAPSLIFLILLWSMRIIRLPILGTTMLPFSLWRSMDTTSLISDTSTVEDHWLIRSSHLVWKLDILFVVMPTRVATLSIGWPEYAAFVEYNAQNSFETMAIPPTLILSTLVTSIQSCAASLTMLPTLDLIAQQTYAIKIFSTLPRSTTLPTDGVFSPTPRLPPIALDSIGKMKPIPMSSRVMLSLTSVCATLPTRDTSSLCQELHSVAALSTCQ